MVYNKNKIELLRQRYPEGTRIRSRNFSMRNIEHSAAAFKSAFGYVLSEIEKRTQLINLSYTKLKYNIFRH